MVSLAFAKVTSPLPGVPMVSDTVKVFIGKVIALIEDPSRFTTAWFAKDADGRSVMWDDPNAVRFDLMGAIEHIGLNDAEGKAEAYDEIERFLDEKKSLNEFVREAKHEAVLAFLRGVITDKEFIPATPEMKPAEAMALPEAAPKKKRGRPKGSKNKK